MIILEKIKKKHQNYIFISWIYDQGNYPITLYNVVSKVLIHAFKINKYT